MSCPTDKEVYRYIEEIVNRDKKIKKLKNDVVDMCNLLSLLVDDCKERAPNGDVPQRLKPSFKDIYESLKLHVKFRLGARMEITELDTLGQKIGLTEDELKEAPGLHCAIDPGSKLLEIFSDIADGSNGPKGSESHAKAVMTQAKAWFSCLGAKNTWKRDVLTVDVKKMTITGKPKSSDDDGRKGSEGHANAVMDQAKDWFGKLPKEKQEEKEKKTNTFKPKVLARVSHKGKWFVGSSVAVSHYLRPLCLYNRILDFKQSLKKAVVYFEPLETEDNVDWKSAAFWFQGVQAYETEKLPCENCKFMFQNLSGFLGGTDNLGEEGASAKPVGGSFLAACGEYPPINQCLPDDTESDNEAVNVALTNFRDKCLVYFKTFYSTVSKCDDAYKSYDKSKKKESEKDKILRKAYNEYVKDRIHIFGIKPECNGSLKP